MASSSSETPNVVVAKDGTGHFTTLSDAVASIPSFFIGRYVIYLKNGIYEENVTIRNANVTLLGDGMGRSVLRSNRNEIDGFHITDSGALNVLADTFIAKEVTFENISPPSKEQAVALRSEGDRSAFYHCEFKSYQDTLYVNGGRQFFRDCNIYGAIDFIFGDAAMMVQNCNIFMRGSGFITAQGRLDQSKKTGISIHRCQIRPTTEFSPMSNYAYLGRPWKDFSRVIIMKTYIDGIISPEGWMDWDGRSRTAEYLEFENNGLGAVDCKHGPGGRVRWPGYRLLCNKRDAEPFSAYRFINGNKWLADTGIPYDLSV